MKRRGFLKVFAALPAAAVATQVEAFEVFRATSNLTATEEIGVVAYGEYISFLAADAPASELATLTAGMIDYRDGILSPDAVRRMLLEFGVPKHMLKDK